MIHSTAFRRLTLGLAAASMLLGAAASSAMTISISTPSSWLAITPPPDQSGNLVVPTPIDSVGLAWEATNGGWNTSAAYDDSAWSPFPGGWLPVANAGTSPMYLRREFTLAGTILPSFITGGGADDDAKIWVNGTLVWNDINGFASGISSIDITSYLVAGENLIAVKAADSFGGGNSFSLSGEVNATPEPTALALLALGLAGLGFSRRKKA